MTEMHKKLGVTDFVSGIKRVENYPDFEKLAHIIQPWSTGDYSNVKNIEGESMAAFEFACAVRMCRSN